MYLADCSVMLKPNYTLGLYTSKMWHECVLSFNSNSDYYCSSSWTHICTQVFRLASPPSLHLYQYNYISSSFPLSIASSPFLHFFDLFYLSLPVFPVYFCLLFIPATPISGQTHPSVLGRHMHSQFGEAQFSSILFSRGHKHDLL